MKTSRKIDDKKNYFFELYLNDVRIKGRKSDFPILYILIRRTVMFLFLYLFFTVSFFFIGNYQRFMDTNLFLITRIASITAVALICFSVAGLVELFVTLLRKSARKSVFSYITNMIFMALAFITGVACLMIFRTIDILSRGIK